MTLLHTKGYSDVLEAVKKRAEKKAVALVPKVPVSALFGGVGRVLASVRQIADTLVMLAADEVLEPSQDTVTYGRFTEQEVAELHLVAAETFLRHYRDELKTIHQEKATREEQAEIAKEERTCHEPCRVCTVRTCAVPANDRVIEWHLCEVCLPTHRPQDVGV